MSAGRLCALGTSLTGSDPTVDLNAALNTTGGGAGHAAATGFLPTDIVIVAVQSYSGGSGGTVIVDNVGAWTDMISGSLTTTNGVFHLWWRLLNQPADATNGPLITVSGSGLSGRGTAVVAFVFRGVKASSPGLTALTTYGNYNQFNVGTNPDPAALQQPTAAANTLVLAIYGHEIIDATVTAPTGYNLTAAAGANSTSTKAQVGGAWRLVPTAGTVEDPPPFTTYSSGNNVTVTIPLDADQLVANDGVTETAATSTTQDATSFTNFTENAAAADVVSCTKSNSSGRVFGGAYTVNFAAGGWGGRTLRQIITPAALAVIPLGPMGARFEFSLATTTLGPAYIGHAAASGDPYDFDGAQVQLTFDGGNATKTLSAFSGSVDTDKVSFPGYDPTKNLIVSIYFGAGVVTPNGYGF